MALLRGFLILSKRCDKTETRGDSVTSEFSHRRLTSFEMAIPSVVSGQKHRVDHLTDSPVILIPFETEAGPFFIEACLKERED